MKSRRSHSPLGVISVALALIILLTLTGTESISLLSLFSLPAVLIIPGYMLMMAVLPRAHLTLIEQIVVSVGVSVTIIILGSIILNVIPGSLYKNSLVLLLGVIIMLASGKIVFSGSRRGVTPLDALADLNVTPLQIVLSALALAVLIGAFMLAYRGEKAQAYSGYTQFWMLPDRSSGELAVSIGVGNNEHAPVAYGLILYADGEPILQEVRIRLDDQEKWTTTFSLPQRSIDASSITARLYRLDATDELCLAREVAASCLQNHAIYRQAVLWEPGAQEGS